MSKRPDSPPKEIERIENIILRVKPLIGIEYYAITIDHVHDHVAQTEIVQVSNYIVAFGSKEIAQAAVNLYENRICMFGMVWRFRLNTFLNLQYPPLQAPSEMGPFYEPVYLNAAIRTNSTKVVITGVDSRVPADVFVPIFRTVGRVTSARILRDNTGSFQSRVEVDYERKENAMVAVERFFNNITVFGQTWNIFSDIDFHEIPLHLDLSEFLG